MLPLNQRFHVSFALLEFRIRSLPPPQPGSPSGDPGPLPVWYWLRVATVMVLIAASTSVVFYRHSSKERHGSGSAGTKGGEPSSLPFNNSQLLAESARPPGVQAQSNLSTLPAGSPARQPRWG